MTCDRCHRPIHAGEERTTFIPEAASGVVPTVYMHSRTCRPVVRQTKQEDTGWRPRYR